MTKETLHVYFTLDSRRVGPLGVRLGQTEVKNRHGAGAGLLVAAVLVTEHESAEVKVACI